MKRTLTICAFLHLYIFTFCALAQDVFLKGNIVKVTTQLQAQGNNIYQGEVTLDDSNVFLFSDKYVYFECPEQSYKSANIRINGGKYTATFNLSTKAWSFEAPTDDNRISAFGSSVCNGQGATGNKGYAYLYGEQLKERLTKGESENAFYVSGISIGGNTTQALLNRYDDMTRDHAKYVIIGLSMGNEGIHESSNKQQTLNQFSTNLQRIISKIKADGKVPVVMNNYTRGDFTLDDYSYVKQMNLLIHQWDVASVNTLGAIDDGTGKWATGYQQALPDLQPRRLRLHQDGWQQPPRESEPAGGSPHHRLLGIRQRERASREDMRWQREHQVVRHQSRTQFHHLRPGQRAYRQSLASAQCRQ